MHDTLYLNNDGSRWVYRDPGAMKVLCVYPDGKTKVRKVEFWGSFGNFAYCRLRVCGNRWDLLPKHRRSQSGLPVVEVTRAMVEKRKS